MATTSNTHIVGGSGQAGPYNYSFPILADADIKVSVNGTVKSVTTHYTLDSSNTRITFVSGQEPSTGDKVIIYRDTDEDPINSTFVSGSTIRSNELNDNFSQLLYIAQESDNQSLSKLGGVMEGDLGLGLKTDLYFEGATDNAYETTLTVTDPTADRTITLPNVTGTVVTTGDTGTVATAMIANDAVNGTKIANSSIDSEHYVSASIDTAHIGDAQITTAKIADGAVTNPKLGADAVTGAKIADDAVNTEHLADLAVHTANIANSAVTTAKLAADCVDASKIANSQINSEHYAADSIDTAHIADAQITTAKLANSAVTTAKIDDDAITGAKLADNSISSQHILADQVGQSEIADNAVQTTHITNNAVNSAKIVDDAVITSKIPDNAVTTAKIADAELKTLAGMQSGTASKLADSTALTADIADLNLLDGKSIVTTIGGNATDVQLPTAQAVNERVVELVTEVGGFHPIANETSFPSTNPDINDGAGTIVSVKALASNLTSNGSGVATIANGAGSGNTVTINGMSNSTTYAAGKGLILETTSTLHTYTFHRLVMDETGVNDAQTLVTDFNNRYRVASSAPSSSLDDGDLYFDTTANKMKVYNASGSSWDDVAAPGNFFINTISSSSGSGGGSATFNGTATRFTLSNAPSQGAQQLVVSVNGVIQKPNSGSSVPSEGFAIDGNDILFSSAPASGSDYFIITLGNSVNIGTPSNNTVTTAVLQNGAVTNAKLGADSVTGAKIADDAIGAEHIEMLDSHLEFADGATAKFGASADLHVYHSGSHSYISELGTGDLIVNTNGTNIYLKPTGNEDGVKVVANGGVELYHDNNKRFETTADGATLTGRLSPAADDSYGLGQSSLRFANLFLSGDIDMKDSDKIKLGASDDLQLYHNGTSYVDASNGHFYIRNNVASDAGGDLFIQAKSGENSIKCQHDGYVELFYDNSKKFETTSAGVTITGDLTVTGSAPGGVTSDGQNNTIAGTNAGDNFSGTDANYNSLFGKEAGEAITTGDHNTAIGYQAGHSQTTAGNNTWVGSYAGESATTGHSNVGIGYATLYDNTEGYTNTAVGRNALLANTTGDSNVAIGAYALTTATTADENVAVGLNALQDNTTGHSNVAIGSQAMREQTTASYNTAVGKQAMQNVTGGENVAIGSVAAITMTTGTQNVAIGREAMNDATTGAGNVCVGKSAGANLTTGGSNVAIGRNALLTATDRNGQVAIGQNALRLNTSGYSNTAIGMEALDACTVGYQNVAVGEHSLRYLTSGDYNTCIGRYSGAGLTEGNRNVGIGPYTFMATTTSSDSVAIGYQAGEDQTTAGECTFIGAQAGMQVTTGDYNTFIGYKAGADSNATTTGDKNQILGAKSRCASSSRYNCTVLGFQETGVDNNNTFFAGGDNWYNRGNNSHWSTTSDQRIKKNITAKDTGLAIINQINVREYDYKTQAEIEADHPEFTGHPVAIPERLSDASPPTKNDDGSFTFPTRERGKVMGLIAQELEAVLPNSVITHGNTIKTVCKDDLFWYMLNSIKELSTKNDALAARIATLEAA